MGDSILFSQSDLKWQQKRKALSAALYKEKLKDMINMMKEITIETIKDNWMKAESIDIVKEASNLFIKITLKCMFGTGFNGQLIA
jgi:cytochrome P450